MWTTQPNTIKRGLSLKIRLSPFSILPAKLRERKEREKERNVTFSLRSTELGSSNPPRPRIKVALHIKGYAYIPKTKVFTEDKKATFLEARAFWAKIGLEGLSFVFHAPRGRFYSYLGVFTT